MVLELRQSLKLAQKLVMTPQLRQAIKLLQLGRLELTEALQAEIEQNPMLEEAPPLEQKENNPESLSAAEVVDTSEPLVTSQVKGDGTENVPDTNWEDYANNFDADFSFAQETPPLTLLPSLILSPAPPALNNFCNGN